MAKKTEPSIDNALNIFKDVMLRASLSNYYYVNRIMISKNNKDQSILILPEEDLWLKIIEDPDIKSKMKELNIITVEDMEMQSLTQYVDDMKEGWINLNAEQIYNGEVIKVTIDGFGYDIPINKNLIPLKLRKTEFNDMSYKVFKESMMLAWKKEFKYPIDNCGFTIVRLWKIV